MKIISDHDSHAELSCENVYVIIPAFNEEKAVGAVIEKLRAICPNVIVVDDGSTDRTNQVALLAGAKVVRHQINLGQGAALKTGFKYAEQFDHLGVITFDSDGQHDPADIPNMIAAANLGNIDVVLGSRFLGESTSMPRSREFLLKVAILFSNALTGLRLTDTHNGLRLFTAQALSSIELTQSRMAHASELLSEIKRLELNYVEIPTKVSYTEYSISKGQNNLGAIKIIFDLVLGWLSR